jgi:methyltransferase (TIGR00027 family)
MAEKLFGDISDTARWVAHFRALEAERPLGIVKDPYARRLAGERGRAIAESLPKLSLEWVIPVRTRVYDELILETLAAGRIDTVLNLAAGLDTRPYRLSLAPSLRWIEVDLPSIVALKAEALCDEQPRCVLERVPCDLNDRGALALLLSRLNAGAARVLVVTEGLLAYLDEAQVRALAQALYECAAVEAWILEAAMPEVLAQARRAWQKAPLPAGAEMKFAPASGLSFFGELGWVPGTTRSLLEESYRLGRTMRLAWLARAVTFATRGREAWRKVAMYGVMRKRSDGAC